MTNLIERHTKNRMSALLVNSRKPQTAADAKTVLSRHALVETPQSKDIRNVYKVDTGIMTFPKRASRIKTNPLSPDTV